MKDGGERGVETSACQKPAERLGQLTRVPIKQLQMLYGSGRVRGQPIAGRVR